MNFLNAAEHERAINQIVKSIEAIGKGFVDTKRRGFTQQVDEKVLSTPTSPLQTTFGGTRYLGSDKSASSTQDSIPSFISSLLLEQNGAGISFAGMQVGQATRDSESHPIITTDPHLLTQMEQRRVEDMQAFTLPRGEKGNNDTQSSLLEQPQRGNRREVIDREEKEIPMPALNASEEESIAWYIRRRKKLGF